MHHDFSAALKKLPSLRTATAFALTAVLLCSCRGPQRACPPSVPGGCPPEAMAAAPPMIALPYPPGMELGIPQPMNPCSPWKPDGLPCPWPQDEYVCDGGDMLLPASVTPDWEVFGLDTEDAVAHYDTLDGRTVVEPSNRVCLYAPRFGAVRQVVSLVSSEQHDRAVGAHLPTKLTQHEELRPPLTAKQHLQPQGEIAARPPVAMLGDAYAGVTSTAIKARAYQDAFLPYENFSIIRMGIMETSEAAMLAEKAEAAIAWTSNEAVQVLVDREGAAAVVRNEQAQQTFTFNVPPGQPKLRVIKVASTFSAQPGDTVDFTIRFDNIGSQTIGNVTILDSLSPRLELVEGSAQCSLKAEFFTEPNQAGSVVLRCELADPLKPFEGGVIRFTCKVR